MPEWMTMLADKVIGLALVALTLLALVANLKFWLAIRSRRRFEVRKCRVVGLLRLADLLSPRCDWKTTSQVLVRLKILYWKNLVELRPLRLRLSVFDESCGGRWLFENEELLIALLSDVAYNLDHEDDRWASREVVRWLMQNPRFYYRKLEGILAQMVKRHPEIEERLRAQIQIAQIPVILTNQYSKSRRRTTVTK